MNIAVAQSGGPTCVINSSLLGVFRQAVKHDEINFVYGSLNGIEGLIYDNLVNLSEVITTDRDIELIRQTPSSLLGSCRYKLPSYEDKAEVYESILATLKKYDIGAFFYIGGNDSMDTVMKLNRFFKEKGVNISVMGIPKTIDNDLPITDHTPGFGSAAKYVATSMKEIIRDSSVYSVDSVTIVEIMGRDTGWLTASSAILHATGEVAPHLIYLPETQFSVKQFLDDIRQVQKKYCSVIVAISEGISLSEEDIGDQFQSGKSDNFGHKYLAGAGKALEKIVERELKCKVRSIELNVMQRCSSHLSSQRDIEEAEAVACEAVKAALNGQSGKMMTFKRLSNNPYSVRIESIDVEMAANRVKYFPLEWINKEGNSVTKEAIDYCLPLVQGELNFHMQNGIPEHYVLKR